MMGVLEFGGEYYIVRVLFLEVGDETKQAVEDFDFDQLLVTAHLEGDSEIRPRHWEPSRVIAAIYQLAPNMVRRATHADALRTAELLWELRT